jgi:predicted ATPase
MDALAVQLAQLENAQLVRRPLDEEVAYIFKHALTQEAGYASLLHKTRRMIHRRVAEGYEKLYPDRLIVLCGLVRRRPSGARAQYAPD